MTNTPHLETERLVLRVPSPADAVAMAGFVTRNKEHFAPWDPARNEDYFTEEHWIVALEGVVESALSGKSLQLVLAS